MDNKTFVCTSDEETRKKLLSEGLMEIKNSNGIYTFLVTDSSKMNFDSKKVTFTNQLCI